MPSPSFSPDGLCVAATSADGSVYLLDALTGDAIWRKKIEGGATSGPAFSPDGRKLAVAGRDKKVYLLAVDLSDCRLKKVVPDDRGSAMLGGVAI